MGSTFGFAKVPGVWRCQTHKGKQCGRLAKKFPSDCSALLALRKRFRNNAKSRKRARSLFSPPRCLTFNRAGLSVTFGSTSRLGPSSHCEEPSFQGMVPMLASASRLAFRLALPSECGHSQAGMSVVTLFHVLSLLCDLTFCSAWIGAQDRKHSTERKRPKRGCFVCCIAAHRHSELSS